MSARPTGHPRRVRAVCAKSPPSTDADTKPRVPVGILPQMAAAGGFFGIGTRAVRGGGAGVRRRGIIERWRKRRPTQCRDHGPGGPSGSSRSSTRHRRATQSSSSGGGRRAPGVLRRHDADAAPTPRGSRPWPERGRRIRSERRKVSYPGAEEAAHPAHSERHLAIRSPSRRGMTRVRRVRAHSRSPRPKAGRMPSNTLFIDDCSCEADWVEEVRASYLPRPERRRIVVGPCASASARGARKGGAVRKDGIVSRRALGRTRRPVPAGGLAGEA